MAGRKNMECRHIAILGSRTAAVVSSGRVQEDGEPTSIVGNGLEGYPEGGLQDLYPHRLVKVL